MGELELLVKEAFEELPADLKEGKHKTGKVVSPVKVTLTPSKEGAEEPKEEILTLDSDEEEVPVKEKPPGLWVKELLLTEQPEDYDSGDDPEYVPPSVIYETDKEYDEYSDDGDKIPQDEVESLLSEQKTPLVPPSSYIPIWVPVSSPAEKIARAKEQLKEAGEVDKEVSKSETSGKDTDSNGKRTEEPTPAVKAVPKLQESATGLTPAMRKMKVDNRTSSEDGEGEVPKPKRERKKSKAKSGDDAEKPNEIVTVNESIQADEGEKSAKGDAATKLVVGVTKSEEAAKVDVPKTPTKAEVKVSPKGDVKSPKAATESKAAAASKSLVKDKSKAAEAKKTPGKKSPTEEVEKLRKRLIDFVMILCLLSFICKPKLSSFDLTEMLSLANLILVLLSENLLKCI